MSFLFQNPDDLASETQRIATQQITRAIGEIDDASLDRHETIHQVRKRCKKTRGLLRLVRSGIGGDYKKENVRFRDAARPLSEARDARVMTDTYDSLMEAFADEIDRSFFAPLRGKLTLRMQAIHEQADTIEEALAEFRQQMEKARDRIPRWALRVTAISDLLDGMEETYGRGRNAMKTACAKPSAEHFHEWRKRVKYHAYHCRLLRELWPAFMDARAHETNRLADILGDAHDLNVFRQLLQAQPDLCVNPERLHAVLELADRHRDTLREEARTLGLRLFSTKPKTIRKQFKLYTTAWRS